MAEAIAHLAALGALLALADLIVGEGPQKRGVRAAERPLFLE